MSKIWIIHIINNCTCRVNIQGNCLKKRKNKHLELLLLSLARVRPQEVEKHHPEKHRDRNGSWDEEDGEAAKPGVHGRQHQQLQLRGKVSGSAYAQGLEPRVPSHREGNKALVILQLLCTTGNSTIHFKTAWPLKIQTHLWPGHSDLSKGWGNDGLTWINWFLLSKKAQKVHDQRLMVEMPHIMASFRWEIHRLAQLPKSELERRCMKLIVHIPAFLQTILRCKLLEV